MYDIDDARGRDRNLLPSRPGTHLGAAPGSDLATRATAAAGARMQKVVGEAEALTRDRPVGLVRRMFPTAEVRARLTGQAQMTEATMQNRLRILEVVHEAERRVMIDVLNAVCVEHGARLRGQMATTLQHELARVISTFDDQFERFTRDMVGRLETAERLPIPVLRERESARIFAGYDDFMEMREKLVAQFKRLVDEQVGM